MKIKYLAMLTIAILATTGFLAFKSYDLPVVITNNPGLGGSRLGDQVCFYGLAKWLSYKHKIPFILTPSKHLDSLVLSNDRKFVDLSNFINRCMYKFFGQKIYVQSEEQLISMLKTLDRPTCFIIGLGTTIKSGINHYDNVWNSSDLYLLSLQYPEFGSSLRKMLQPLQTPQYQAIPQDRISVAVHIRKGGGIDPALRSQQYYQSAFSAQYKQYLTNEKNIASLEKQIQSPGGCSFLCTDTDTTAYSDRLFPDKFPPEQYYVDQISKLSEILQDQPLYVCIFTDDKNPQELLQKIKHHINKQNIEFDCVHQHNSANSVTYDWHYIAQFDCLIRSGSCFTYTSQFVANYKIIMFPIHLTWQDRERLFVDTVGVYYQDEFSRYF